MTQNTQKTKLLGFTLIELLVVMVILGVLATLGGGSFLNSLQKSRDARRKSDVGQIQKALELYYNDHGQYPLSNASHGIDGCDGPCLVGEEFADENGTVYMVDLPGDPGSAIYHYASPDGSYYQIYARLENLEDRDIPEDVDGNKLKYSGVDCEAVDDCNYGVSSSNATPADNRTLVVE